MSVFRGPIQGQLPDGSVIATAADVAQALADAIAAQGAAESAQQAAEAALDSFDSRYLGPKTSDPTVDNDGDPLADGVLYFNTTDNVIKVYDLGTDSWITFDLSDEELQAISTVNSIQTEITTLAGISSDVVSVSQISGDVTSVSGVTTEVSAVSNIANEIAGVYSDLASAAFITDFGLVSETATVPPDAGTGYIVTVFDNLDDITSVADNISVISNADVFAQEAQDARDKAELWAEEDEDVEVEPGQFSSKHHAFKSEDSATAAALSETDAETAASNALTSENNASNSASAALTSEQNAATSESNALTSEQNAAQSESNASDSEQAALQAATDAETALDNFTDQYLGPKASDPATDNDGDPLLEGAIYYNTIDNQLRIYDGTNWTDAVFSVDGAVISFNGREGAVTLNSTDVETALGYTPQDQSTAYDSAEFDTDFGTKTTDDLTEGTVNLYYADTLVDSHLIGGTGVTYNAGNISIGQDVSTTTSVTFLDAQFTGTTAVTLPDGTEAQRPATPEAGMLRFNTDLSSFEGYDGSAWGEIGGGGGGATGGNDDQVFYENDQVVTADYTITANKNAMSTGPVTVDSGVTVTVESGARYVVI